MKDPTTRDLQLSFFDGLYVIKQDQELLDLIRTKNYRIALGIGAVGWLHQHIQLVNHGMVDLCIYILNEPFDFDQAIEKINSIIEQNMNSNGLIYWSLNKYLAKPKVYAQDLPDDYDQAIEQFVCRNVHADIEQYHACGKDQGIKFNWVHPLTRFYLRVRQS